MKPLDENLRGNAQRCAYNFRKAGCATLGNNHRRTVLAVAGAVVLESAVRQGGIGIHDISAGIVHAADNGIHPLRADHTGVNTPAEIFEDRLTARAETLEDVDRRGVIPVPEIAHEEADS